MSGGWCQGFGWVRINPPTSDLTATKNVWNEPEQGGGERKRVFPPCFVFFDFWQNCGGFALFVFFDFWQKLSIFACVLGGISLRFFLAIFLIFVGNFLNEKNSSFDPIFHRDQKFGEFCIIFFYIF